MKLRSSRREANESKYFLDLLSCTQELIRGTEIDQGGTGIEQYFEWDDYDD